MSSNHLELKTIGKPRNLASIIEKKSNQLIPIEIPTNFVPKSEFKTKPHMPELLNPENEWPTLPEKFNSFHNNDDNWSQDMTNLDIVNNMTSESPNAISNINNLDTSQVKKPTKINLTYEKNSLEAYVVDFRKKITEHATHPVLENMRGNAELMLKFQNKFIQTYKSWYRLMISIQKQMSHLDKKYNSSDYFGLKNILVHHLFNIMVSFILIGPDTKSGSGIDNLNGYKFEKNNYQDNSDNDTKPSINDQITIFFEILPEQLLSISNKTAEIKKCDDDQFQLLKQTKNLGQRIENLKKTIKKQTNEINKGTDKNMLKLIEKQLQKNNESLKLAIHDNKELDNKINNIIIVKKECLGSIKQSIDDLAASLKFSFFMHDEWYYQLDHGIFPNPNDNSFV